MDSLLRLNEFFVEGGNQKQSHVLLHITEPSTPEERAKGYFFAICEINGADGKNILCLQKIIEEIENGYYETPDGTEKNSLETMLDRVNQEGGSLLDSGMLISCVAGAIRPPKIFFSFHGQPQIILFYKNKEGLYKNLDLTVENNDATGSRYLFPQMIEGKVSPGDYLFFGTPHIINYFDHDRLHKIVTGRTAEEGSRHLQKVLSELKNGFSFGGLIINSVEKTEAAGGHRPQSVRAEKHLPPNSLFVTEQNTESTLSPSLLQRTGKKIKNLLNRQNDTEFFPIKNPDDTEPSAPPVAKISSSHLHQHRIIRINRVTIKEYLAKIAQTVWSAAKFSVGLIWWFLFFVGTIIGEILRNLVLIFFVITNWQNRRHSILDNWAHSWRNSKRYIKELPLLTKILAIISLLMVITLTGSIIYGSWKQKQVTRQKIYDETTQTIKLKRDAAESALIYNNESEARNDLLTAADLLSRLECRSAAEKDDCQKLQTQLNELLAKTRRLSNVSARLIAEWNPAAVRLFKINGKIVSYGPTTSTLFIYDLLTKERKIISPAETSGFSAAAVPKENDYALLLYNKKDILRFNPKDNSLQKIDVSYGRTDAPDIASVVVYDRRLYSLDIAGGQIFKHDSIKTGFAEGKNWLKEAAPLNDGIDLAVEGDVFVLKGNGEILRFTAGRRQPFSVLNLDPRLSGGAEIWSYNDLRYLYVLDGAQKRLIILEKDGRLKIQLTTSEFQNPGGMVVDENNETAYIIDNGKLYQINLPI